MSRATWYRRGKPTSKPERRTQKQEAEALGVSIRTLYRHDRAYWSEFYLRRNAAMRASGFNGPWDGDGIRAWINRHPEQVEAIHIDLEAIFEPKLGRARAAAGWRRLLARLEAHAKANPGKQFLWQGEIYASGGHIRSFGEGCSFESKETPP